MQKLISIVIATFNASKTLYDCLNSIVPQLNDDCELVIIDGKSSDDTLDIISSFGNKIDYVISEPDKGIYDAWNKGIKVARGKWIGFIGADDIMNDGAINAFMDILKNISDIDSYDLICAYNQFVDNDGHVLRRIGSKPIWEKIKRGNCIAHVCSLHNKKNLFETIGHYNIDFLISADYEMLVRKKENLKSYFFESYIMKMKVGGMSFSTEALKEVYQIRKLHHTVSNVENIFLYIRDLVAFKVFVWKSKLRGNVWGVNDDITGDWLMEQLKQRKEGPWFTTWLTLSSHEPFEVPYHRLEEKIPNAFAYTDECLGKLIDGLKQTDLWENLLIVCIPDHGFCYPQGTTDRGGEFSHIPMLWLGGAIKEPMKLDKIMNQTDMAATLLGQLELDYSMFPFSRNVLSDSYVYPFAFYTSSSVFAFRDSTGVTAYDLKGERISWEEPSASEDRLNRGKAILQSAYDELGKR